MQEKYKFIRDKTSSICSSLSEVELKCQPDSFVSPPIWHLGHTTWLIESFILTDFCKDYQPFNPKFNFIFNSYYKSAGEHCPQSDRGKVCYNVNEVLEFRNLVDQNILNLLKSSQSTKLSNMIELVLNHEQQHQELLIMDIKAIQESLGKQSTFKPTKLSREPKSWYSINEGLYEIGENQGEKFLFDNESPKHKFYQYGCKISTNLVTNLEYQEFIDCGGYQQANLWLSKGWDWIKENEVVAPLYWNSELDPLSPVTNISYFEANAYANFKELRLPTEQEHEIFDERHNYKKELWAWTSSQYTGYPKFKTFNGLAKEYNGKFMCNQFVLRGGCFATPDNHWRSTYRNFYEPNNRWLFSGIRLVKD